MEKTSNKWTNTKVQALLHSRGNSNAFASDSVQLAAQGTQHTAKQWCENIKKPRPQYSGPDRKIKYKYQLLDVIPGHEAQDWTVEHLLHRLLVLLVNLKISII